MRPSSSGITVVGTATTSTTADRVRLRMAVERSAPTAADALTRSGDDARALLATLREIGVCDESVQTVGLSLDQQWGDRGKVTGYVARQRFSAVVADVASAGDTLERLATQIGDGFRVETVEVFADAPTDAADASRAAAFDDALRQARALAQRAGRRLGAVRSISTVGPGGPPVFGGVARAMAKQDSFAPGEVSVQESVRVSWDWADEPAQEPDSTA